MSNSKSNKPQEPAQEQKIEISDREKLCAQKMMENLCTAAHAISEAHEWAEELEQMDWYVEPFGFSTAEHGICRKLSNAYRIFCEAHGLPLPKDEE